MEKVIISTQDKNKRLDNYLLDKIVGKTRSAIKKHIESGEVKVNNQIVKAGYALKVGDEITIDIAPDVPMQASAQNIPLDIIYEDDDLAVINKPQGMVVHPSIGNRNNTLVNALVYKMNSLSSVNGTLRPGIVHRLDKDTSGLIVVAKNDFAHVALSKQIAEKTCKRVYVALLLGIVKQTEGIIENYIGIDPKNRLKKAVVSKEKGRYAKTAYKVLKYYKGYTLMQFELFTGRTHQIRVHATTLNHPIVGDTLYNPHKSHFKLNGQLLHAKEISFVHPRTNQVMHFETQLPDYFVKVLNSLKEDDTYRKN